MSVDDEATTAASCRERLVATPECADACSTITGADIKTIAVAAIV
jgi:hypothetical protein